MTSNTQLSATLARPGRRLQRRCDGEWTMQLPERISGALLMGLLISLGSAPALADGFTPDAEYHAMGGLDAINAADAYALGYSGKGVKVGVYDTGFDASHSEFSGRSTPGYNPVTGGPVTTDVDPAVEFPHGTAVAGVIAAGRNGQGMQGVAYAATIVPFADGTIDNPDVSNSETAGMIFDYARTHGVGIMNNSWTVGLLPVDVPDTDAFYTENKPFIDAAQRYVDAGGLVVFGASNDGDSMAALPASLPDLFPTLQKGWLAVVATNNAGSTLASYSNQCGNAKDYCLAAPGGDIPLPENGMKTTFPGNGYVYNAGTSFAAPLVAGTAALVSEAYPWMTGHQLQQTLLTTATDIGDPGVDEVYGWGLLNAGKAVRGPAQFTDDWLANVTPGRYTFSNDINGVGGLTKAGSGTLVLTGNDTYSGATQVQQGTLIVNGSLTSNVMVEAAGTLGGTGMILADVVNAGTVSPGNSIGTLNVASYTAQPGSRLLIEFAPASGASDVLNVSGNAALGGTLSLLPVGASSYAPHILLTPLTAGSTTGSFDSLNVQGYSQLLVNQTVDATGVILDVDATRPNPLPLAQTATQRGVGRVLTNADSSKLGSFATALAWTPDSAVPTTLDALSGQIHAAAAWSALQSVDPLRSQVLGYVLGRGASPLGANIHTYDNGVRLWFNPQYAHTSVGSGSDNFPKAVTSGWGLSAGVDNEIRPGLRVGLAAAYSHLDTNLKQGSSGSANANNGFLAAYGSLDLSDWQLNAIAGGGHQTIDSKRYVNFSGLSQKLKASRDGNMGFAGLELRRDLGLGNGAWVVTPRLGLNGTVQSLDGFSESGGSTALKGKSENLSSLQSTVGVTLSHSFQANGKSLTFWLSPAWGYEFLNSGTHGELKASFKSDPSAGRFQVDSTKVGRNSLILPVGLNVQLTPGMQLGVGYQGRYANDLTAQEGRVSLSWNF